MREGSKIEKRIRLDCAGRAPELIGYMAMSIRLSPSLTRAITFAAKNMEGPIGSGLKRIIWNVYTRKYHSVEESFTATATEWGKWNDDLKRALFELKASTLETTEEGRERSLNKAMDTVLSGTKKRMEEFASSLSTPTTVLFALGILLPMILGAMLPMISLGGLDLSYQAASSGTMSRGGIHPVLIVLMMDVIFPAAALVYALNILSDRPGPTTTFDSKGIRALSKGVILLIALGTTLGMLGIMNLDTFGSYMIVWSIALPVSAHLISATHRKRREGMRIRKLEEELPDALFYLGTRITEGKPIEKAMMDTAISMKDAEIAELLRRVHYRTMVFGLTLEKALFGERGVLLDVHSATLKATLKSFVEVASKDSVKAGQMIVKTAEHLKDLQRLEEETRRRLRMSTESMKMTALFFAPIVMGVTFALYVLLTNTFGMIGSSDDMMAPHFFFIVLGVYLSLMIAISMYFVATVEKGNEEVERRHSIGIGLIVGIGVFTVSSIIGQMVVV
jgi:hypothetical protein